MAYLVDTMIMKKSNVKILENQYL